MQLTFRHEYNVGQPYGTGEGHNYSLHVPNGKARGFHEHVLGNGR
jgi:hypothetical protein